MKMIQSHFAGAGTDQGKSASSYQTVTRREVFRKFYNGVTLRRTKSAANALSRQDSARVVFPQSLQAGRSPERRHCNPSAMRNLGKPQKTNRHQSSTCLHTKNAI